MFGMMETIYGFIRRQVGLRTDAASATGSLHAKVAELRSYVNTQLALVQKPRGIHGRPGSFSTSQTTYQTALSVTGKGKLTHLAVYTGTGGKGKAKVTIDGNLVTIGSFGTNQQMHYPTADFFFSTSEANYIFGATENAAVNLSYKTALKIEIAYESGPEPAKIFWQYEHE